MSPMTRPIGYWILQAFFILSVPLMLMGQTLCLFDYDLAVSMGMQESAEQVGLFGVQFNKAFGFSDTVVYIPLLAASAVGLWRRSPWALTMAGAALGISAYWSLTITAAFFLLPGTPGYAYAPGRGIITFVAAYAIIGVLGLAYILIRGRALLAPPGQAPDGRPHADAPSARR